MSLYIQKQNGEYVLASEEDINNRGYISTLEIDPIPQTEEPLMVSVFVKTYSSDRKVRIIKCIRNTLRKHYRFDSMKSSWDLPIPEQKGYIKPFGLKHLKDAVEGQPNAYIYIPYIVFGKIQKDLKANNLDVQWNREHQPTNLEKLVEHREKLLKEINKIDDLIAWQLYG